MWKYGLVQDKPLNEVSELDFFNRSIKYFLIQSLWQDSDKIFETSTLHRNRKYHNCSLDKEGYK